ADAFLAAVLELAARAGHVLGVAPVRAGDARRALPDRGAVAVHAGVAAAEHHDMLAGKIDPGPLLAVHAELAVHVGDQVGQRLVNAWQIEPGEVAAHRLVRAHAEEHGVIFLEQALERQVLADTRIEHEADPHALHDLAA